MNLTSEDATPPAPTAEGESGISFLEEKISERIQQRPVDFIKAS